ncbi:hypothetical protein P8452_28029 [Trifolium repens]|nr:hypothetical protein P8452_28029 [Trifolium repens]
MLYQVGDKILITVLGLVSTVPKLVKEFNLSLYQDLASQVKSLHHLANSFPSKNLYLARNRFVGEIPSEIGKLHNLSILQLSENNFTGKFPFSTFSNLSSIVVLSLTNNNLSGELPQNFGNTFPNLRQLTLATNRFEGVIPNSISNSSHLDKIDLSDNRFHGPIPLFNNLKNLTYLTLGHNFLTSTTSLNFQFFDSLRNSTLLEILKVNDNYLAGELPNSIAYLSGNLQQLCVANNQLNGSIPEGMKKFQNLASLSFEQNYFTGELPLELGTLKKLENEDMVAHVADFGLARFLSQNPSEKHSSTLELKGSIGYIAPEYGLGGKASTSGDVYSFRILLLEMFIAKKPTDEIFKEGLSLNKFVSDMDEKQLLNVVDQRLISGDCHSSCLTGDNGYSDGNTDWMHKAEECIAAAMRVGLSCVAHHPNNRWTMREAVSKLHGIKQSILGL